jgi:site-specific DNA-adenine methylase
MSWIGGKKSLRELIVKLFPLYYERYIEVFGGGGWVLFHKAPGNDFEVYNDFNSLLTVDLRFILSSKLQFILSNQNDELQVILPKFHNSIFTRFILIYPVLLALPKGFTHYYNHAFRFTQGTKRN